MNKTFALMSICAAVLALSACDKTTPMTPTPTPTVDTPVQVPVTVYPPVDIRKTDQSGKPTDGTRHPAQGPRATPMPGQNNDHSAPLGAGKPASAP